MNYSLNLLILTLENSNTQNMEESMVQGNPIYSRGGFRRPLTELFEPSPWIPISRITRDPWWWTWPQYRPFEAPYTPMKHSPYYLRDSYLSPIKRNYLWDRHPIRPFFVPLILLDGNLTPLNEKDYYITDTSDLITRIRGLATLPAGTGYKLIKFYALCEVLVKSNPEIKMSTTEKKECKICKIPGLKPPTKENIMYYYIPVAGAVNYATLSVNVMNPSLITSIFRNRDVTNLLLVNSIIGSGLYIYSRQHLHTAPMQKRILFSGFEAVLFNFGSVLLWAVGRTVSPKSNCIATILGLLTGAGLIYTGHSYLKYLDNPSPAPAK